MKRALFLIIGTIGILIGLAMAWHQTEAVMGLVVALAAALPKLIDKVT